MCFSCLFILSDDGAKIRKMIVDTQKKEKSFQKGISSENLQISCATIVFLPRLRRLSAKLWKPEFCHYSYHLTTRLVITEKSLLTRTK